MKNKVEEQKGPIKADQPTSKFLKPEVRAEQDAMNHSLRRSGQTLTLHEPKQKRK